MPVRKYRNVGEMKGPPPGRPLDASNLRMAFDLMELAAHLSPIHYPPGVQRFRSLEDVDKYREAVHAAGIRRARSARGRRRQPGPHTGRG